MVVHPKYNNFRKGAFQFAVLPFFCSSLFPSSVGAMHNGEMVSETQQSYSDSRSGMQKAALERAKGQRARKIIKVKSILPDQFWLSYVFSCQERTHGGKETSRDILKNVREDETGAFDNVHFFCACLKNFLL